jgi:glycosyltransferase involved in cell wall biosynthesis
VFVSAIITTYKRPHFLKTCLQSVFAQGDVLLEVIVVDDGTPGEANATICAAFPEVTYVKIPNSGGPATPRNVGFGLSKGPYVAFIDDDDQWLPTKSASQVAILNDNPDYVLVHSPMEVVNEDGSPRNEICGIPGRPDYKHGLVWQRMVGNFTLMMPTVMLRREVFDWVGGFNEKLPPGFEDVEFWTKASFYGPFFYQPEVTALYRATPGGLSRHNPLVVHQPLYVLEGVLQLAKAGKISPEQQQQAIDNLAGDQIRRFSMHPITALKNCFSIQPFWWLRLQKLKMLAVEVFRYYFKKTS